MDKKDRDGNVTGAQVWYRCSEVRSTAATGSRSRSGNQSQASSEAVAS